MPTVADLTLAIASCLIAPRFGLTDQEAANSTSISTGLLDEPAGLFDGGVLWLLSGDHAGKCRKVTSYTETGVINFTPALSGGAKVPGDVQFAVIDGRYPLDMLTGALNQALSELGPFTQKNESLVVVADQTEYTLPAGVRDVRRLQFATQDQEPYAWTAPHHWWQEHGGKIILDDYHIPSPLLEGNKIRIWYEAPHARVLAETDQVTGDVHPQRIAWYAAWVAARQRNARGDTSDSQTRMTEEAAFRQAMTLQREHPVRRMPKDQIWPNYA